VLEKAEKMYEGKPRRQKECRRQVALCYMGLGKRLMQEGNHMPARQVFKALRGRYVSSMEPEEALECQKLLLACEAIHVSEWIIKGDSYSKQGMFEDAIRWYSKVRRLTFSNTITLQAEERIRSIEKMGKENLAKIDFLMSQKRFASAMTLAESIEKRYPKDVRIVAMFKYVDAATVSKQFEAAANKLFSIAKRYPDDEKGVLAYAQVGYLYGITMKQPQQGLALFQAMSKWNASDRRVQRESQLGAGIMLALLGKKEEALKILTSVAIANVDSERTLKLCRDYIWKCKNCNQIGL
jgi:tetratricopeptide (TPR) repeat protein